MLRVMFHLSLHQTLCNDHLFLPRIARSILSPLLTVCRRPQVYLIRIRPASGYLNKGTKDKEELDSKQINSTGKVTERQEYSRRLWKAKKGVHKMVLGSDIGLAETCSLALCGLVGRLSYKYLCNVSIPEWVDENWRKELGYSPR
jgi:hypothetical protein